ncbi:NitT/TauT family transport system substrate-binding protein [Psychromicrobium silvestre]|uniref:NitT/TauT family transport system substrate-binding protein n=1 Tax=Psychromicrobium silvestre TaxID=1645614 RepID=A0A7Y9LTT2_9MICC|nr:ABC transporter substrate-binding protein [Psychromicrobium silvestre]NYE95473.1 NitT/TauT family transport system substrate-binding protein [Psychromicrobium silvestre]
MSQDSELPKSGKSASEPAHDEEIKTTKIVAGQKPPKSQKPKKRGFFTKSRTLEVSVAVGIAAVIAIGAASVTIAANANNANNSQQADDLKELRLGYFGNVTHALPVVGVQQGFYAKELGKTALKTQIFNAGPAAIEALNAGAIDAAYLGPSPAINSFVKSQGQSISIVAGAASGGAQLVVRPSINKVADLKGKVLATPQLGGTQDVALRNYLADNGLKVATNGGNDVTINPTENAQTLKLFQDGKLDGAWLPEPWASRLVLEAGAKVLVDEKDLWKDGQFPTTILIVNKTFLKDHPDAIKSLLKAQLETQDWLSQHKDQAISAVNAGLVQAAGKGLSDDVLKRALDNLTLTDDPLASTYKTLLDNGVKAGVTKESDINGIFDLRLLNEILKEQGKPVISADGLGES